MITKIMMIQEIGKETVVEIKAGVMVMKKRMIRVIQGARIQEEDLEA